MCGHQETDLCEQTMWFKQKNKTRKEQHKTHEYVLHQNIYQNSLLIMKNFSNWSLTSVWVILF